MKQLTLGEIAKVEDLTGRSIDDQDQPRGKYLIALTYVLKRRETPDFTYADAENMDASEAGEVVSAFFEDADEPGN
jgi:hypothetical protein